MSSSSKSFYAVTGALLVYIISAGGFYSSESEQDPEITFASPNLAGAPVL